MIDPVMQDLDRHLADLDRSDDTQIWLEQMREQDPEAYGRLTDEELLLELAE